MRREPPAVDFDWVEVPAGETVIGISEQQRHRLLRRLHRQVGGVWQLFGDNRKRLKAVEWLLLHVREATSVRLNTFHISRFPITLEQFVGYDLAAGRPVAPGNRRLLEDGWGKLPALVDYHRALAFCRDHGVRLPSSIEWEKAARGPAHWLYPWGDRWDAKRANVDRRIAEKLPRDRPPRNSWATEVDAYPAGRSAYGVWDLVGNHQEWTSSHGDFPLRQGGYWRVHVVRRWPIRLSDDLAWARNLLAVEHPNEDGRAHAEWYIGFRVVRDRL